MKLVTYRLAPDSAGRLGAIVGGDLIDVERLGIAAKIELPVSMQTFIDLGPTATAALKKALTDGAGNWPVGAAFPVENATFLAPIPRPRKNIFGIGLNYVEHAAESSRALDTKRELPTKPVLFSKPPTTVVGPGDPIHHNAKMTQQLDWEVELAVIIGKTARKVEKKDALDHVFGYSVLNDISARDNRREGQWIFSKGQDTFAPFGPYIVTKDEVPDPQALDLWLTVNGVEKQRSNTRYMLFDVAHLIMDISSAITLEPGDIIATGTPAGVGAGRTPQEWLWPGDVVEAEVQGLGRLRNPIVAI